MEEIAERAPDEGGERLPKAWRMLKRADFVRAQRSATSIRGAFFVLVLHVRADDGPTRLGIIASRKAGNAVQRNRGKRLIREWFRRHRARIPARSDVLVIMRRGADEQRYAGVCSELDASLKRALAKTSRRHRRAGTRRGRG